MRQEFGSAGAGASWRALGLKTAGAYSTKGQLISKCLFGAIVLTKKTTNFFKEFLPQPLKRGQIKKIKALYYTNQGVFNIIGTYNKGFGSTPFWRLGQKS